MHFSLIKRNLRHSTIRILSSYTTLVALVDNCCKALCNSSTVSIVHIFWVPCHSAIIELKETLNFVDNRTNFNRTIYRNIDQHYEWLGSTMCSGLGFCGQGPPARCDEPESHNTFPSAMIFTMWLGWIYVCARPQSAHTASTIKIPYVRHYYPT